MFIPNPPAGFGEGLAAKYLVKKGYKIIDKSFCRGYGEIDLIAEKKIKP